MHYLTQMQSQLHPYNILLEHKVLYNMSFKNQIMNLTRNILYQTFFWNDD